MVGRPQRDGAVLLFPAQLHRRGIEARSDGAKAIGRHPCVGQRSPQQIEQQRCQQRPLNHQRRVKLLIDCVGPVIMDAMTIVGERRVAEQQHRVGLNCPSEVGIRGRCFASGRRRRSGWYLAIYQVLLFLNANSAVLRQLVIERHEDKRAASARFRLYGPDHGLSRSRPAQGQRRDDVEMARRPHPPWQRHRRHESTQLRVAVRSGTRSIGCLQEVQPMPGRR